MAAGCDQFADIWPDLSARLRRALEGRGVPTGLIDDIVQESGLRLLRNWDHVDQRTLWALTLTIAGNIIKDEMRKSVRRDRFIASHPDQGVVDIEERAIARVELSRVKKALSALTKNQQLVLMAEIGHVGSINRSAVKMTRMRARQRLRAVLERASAGVALLGHRVRRVLSADPRGSLAEQMPQAVAAALLVVAGAEFAFFGAIAPNVNPREAQRPGMSMSLVDTQSLSGAPSEGTSVAGGSTSGAISYVGTSDRRRARGGDEVLDHGGEIGPDGAEHWVTSQVLGNSTRAKVSAEHDSSECDDDPFREAPLRATPKICMGNVSVGAEVVVNEHKFGVRVSTNRALRLRGADGI